MHLSMADMELLQMTLNSQLSSLILKKCTHSWEKLEIKPVLESITSNSLLKIIRIQAPFIRI